MASRNNRSNRHQNNKNGGKGGGGSGGGGGGLVHSLMFPAFANSGSNDTFQPTVATASQEQQQHGEGRQAQIDGATSVAAIMTDAFSEAETEVHDNRQRTLRAVAAKNTSGMGAFSEAETEIHDNRTTNTVQNHHRALAMAAAARENSNNTQKLASQKEEEQGKLLFVASDGQDTAVAAEGEDGTTIRQQEQQQHITAPCSPSSSLSPSPESVNEKGDEKEGDVNRSSIDHQSQSNFPADEDEDEIMGPESPPKLPRRPFCLQNRSLSNVPAIGGALNNDEDADDPRINNNIEPPGRHESFSSVDGNAGIMSTSMQGGEGPDDSFFLFMQQQQDEQEHQKNDTGECSNPPPGNSAAQSPALPSAGGNSSSRGPLHHDESKTAERSSAVAVVEDRGAAENGNMDDAGKEKTATRLNLQTLQQAQSKSLAAPPPPSPGERKSEDGAAVIVPPSALSLTRAHLEAQDAAAAAVENGDGSPLLRLMKHANQYEQQQQQQRQRHTSSSEAGGVNTTASSGVLSTASEMGTVIAMDQRLAQIEQGNDYSYDEGNFGQDDQNIGEESNAKGPGQQQQQHRPPVEGEEGQEHERSQLSARQQLQNEAGDDIEDDAVIRRTKSEDIHSSRFWNDDDDDEIGAHEKKHLDQHEPAQQQELSDEAHTRLSLAIRRIGSGLSSTAAGGSGSDAAAAATAQLVAARSFSTDDHDPMTPRSAVSAAAAMTSRSPHKKATTMTLPYFPTSHYAIESSNEPEHQQQNQQQHHHSSSRDRNRVHLSPRASKGKKAAAASTQGDPTTSKTSPSTPPRSFLLRSPGSSAYVSAATGRATSSTKATVGQRKNDKKRFEANTSNTHGLSPRLLRWNNNHNHPEAPRTPSRPAVTSATALPNIDGEGEQQVGGELASPSRSSSAGRNPLQMARACFSFDGYYNNPTLDNGDTEFCLKPLSRSHRSSRHHHHHQHHSRQGGTEEAAQSPYRKDLSHARDRRSSDGGPQQQQILASLSWDVGSSGGVRKGPSSIHGHSEGKASTTTAASSAFRSAPYTRGRGHPDNQQQQKISSTARATSNFSSAFEVATPQRPRQHPQSLKQDQQHPSHASGHVGALAAASDFSPTVNTDMSVELKSPQRIEIEREDALDILACLVERGVSLHTSKTVAAVDTVDKGEGVVHGGHEGSASPDDKDQELSDTATTVQELRRALLETSESDSKVKQQQMVQVFDELVRSHEYALEMSRAAQSASSWLKSIGRSQQDSGIATNDSVEVVETQADSIPSGQETGGLRADAQPEGESSVSNQIDLLATKAMLNSSQLELAEKSTQMERLNEELAKCRAEIGRLMSVSQTVPFKSPNRSILDASDDMSLNEDDDEDDDLTDSERKGGDDGYLDASFPTDAPLFDVEASNQNVVKYQSALDQANETIRKLHGALKDQSSSPREVNDDIPDEAPVVFIDDVPRQSYSPGNKDEGMVNVRMLDGENFSTDWDKLVPPLPPPPDHDLRSPIVQSFLEQWTTDTSLQDSLLTWMEQVLSGRDPASIPPLAISSLDHQVRDGLTMHVLALLLRRPDIGVDVKTRAHRRTTYDLAVSVESLAPQPPPPPPPAFSALTARGLHNGFDSNRLRHLESISALSDVGGGPGSVAVSVTHSAATALMSNAIGSLPQQNKTFFPSLEGRGGGMSRTTPGGVSSPLSYDEMTEDLSGKGQTPGLISTLGGALGGFLTRSSGKTPALQMEHSPRTPATASEDATMSAAVAANVAATTMLESPKPYATSSEYYKSHHQNNLSPLSPDQQQEDENHHHSAGSDAHFKKGSSDSHQQPVVVMDRTPPNHHPEGDNNSHQHQQHEVEAIVEPYHRVVSAPPGRIGVTFVEYRGHAMVSDVAANSPLDGWIFPSDILIAIDELPVSGMRVRDIIAVLMDRKDRQRALRIISSHDMNEFTVSSTSGAVGQSNDDNVMNQSNADNDDDDNANTNTSLAMTQMAG